MVETTSYMMRAAGIAAEPTASLAAYISESAAALVLERVRVIDGTGAAPAEESMTSKM